METFGIVFSGATFIIGIIITIIRKVDDLLIKAKNVVQEEFAISFKEFGYTVSADITSAELEKSTQRLKKLHYSSSFDINLINYINIYIERILNITVFSILLPIASLLIGIFAIEEDTVFWGRFTLIIIIPFFFLIITSIILVSILSAEKKLKKIIDRYKNMEY